MTSCCCCCNASSGLAGVGLAARLASCSNASCGVPAASAHLLRQWRPHARSHSHILRNRQAGAGMVETQASIAMPLQWAGAS